MNFSIRNFAISKNNGVNLNNQAGKKYSNLLPLSCDTVSFGAMKKNEFEGIDLLVINKFKAPVEKFNTNQDLQNWCKDKIEDLKEKDLKGRRQETTIQRKATFKEWCDYVLKENSAYTNSIALLIFDGILKNVKQDNDMEIPPLNKGVLAETISIIENKTKTNPKLDINFNKEYRLALQNMSMDTLETHIDGDKTGWVVIPSYEHDPEHFNENVDKLKSLSHKNWCTASFNAEPYLKKGDFHVYLEKGRPKLGVRFDGDTIQEIQGEKNNSKIPLDYLKIAKEHTKDEKLSNSTKGQYESAKKTQEKKDATINKLKEQGVDIKTCSTAQLFDALGIKHEIDKDGLIILDEYRQPYRDLSFEDLGINENKLFKDIKEIKGDLDLRETIITDLGALKKIGGNATFEGAQITDLGNLETIGGKADFNYSRVTSLGNLKTIGEDAFFIHSKVKDLGNLETIGGNARFGKSEITSLGNLKEIKGNANFDSSIVAGLSGLQRIGGDISIYDSKLSKKDFKNVKLGCAAIQIENKLKEQGVNFKTCSPEQLFDVLGIEYEKDDDGLFVINKYKQPSTFNLGDVGVDENKLFKSIKEIKGNADFKNSKLTDLGALQKIGGDAYFCDSKITDLSDLESIEGSVIFSDSKIKSLKNLKTIGSSADFYNSKVKDLGALQTIGGDIFIEHSNLKCKDFKNIDIRQGSVRKIENKLKEQGVDLKTCSPEQLFNAVGLKYEKDNDGLLILDEYRQPNFDNSEVTFENLGIDENKLFENIKEIKGNADFAESKVSDLGSLQTIGKDVSFYDSKIKSLKNLKTIGGDANFDYSNIVDLGELQRIGKNANFKNSKISNLKKLEYIGGNVHIKDYCRLKKKDFKDIEVAGNIIDK